ncbi:MAG TPA: hypothetical protein VM692_01145, partial [Gammaproteobacteria bacterium]|nr:hypothetical protein [Gammaproteobacteria bacterium]
LDLVPVAVRRNDAGRVGSLTLDVAALPTETQRAAELGSEAACPLPDQWQAMQVFDVLAHNDARTPETMRYGPADLSLVLADNEDLFGTATDVPDYLRRTSIEVSAYLAERLRMLDEPALARSVGDVLDEPRRAALLARRDRLLAR